MRKTLLKIIKKRRITFLLSTSLMIFAGLMPALMPPSIEAIAGTCKCVPDDPESPNSNCGSPCVNHSECANAGTCTTCEGVGDAGYCIDNDQCMFYFSSGTFYQDPNAPEQHFGGGNSTTTENNTKAKQSLTNAGNNLLSTGGVCGKTDKDQIAASPDNPPVLQGGGCMCPEGTEHAGSYAISPDDPISEYLVNNPNPDAMQELDCTMALGVVQMLWGETGGDKQWVDGKYVGTDGYVGGFGGAHKENYLVVNMIDENGNVLNTNLEGEKEVNLRVFKTKDEYDAWNAEHGGDYVKDFATEEFTRAAALSGKRFCGGSSGNTPISLVWNEGEEAKAAAVQFALDPSKEGTYYTWKASADRPLLVVDRDRNGKIDSATELFGNFTAGKTWDNGYEALASFDRDGDGIVSGGELSEISLWFDKNRDGISQTGEIVSLEEAGVTKLFFKTDKTDLLTGDIHASVGYERVIDGETLIGASVDWIGYGGLASEAQVLKIASTLNRQSKNLL